MKLLALFHLTLIPRELIGLRKMFQIFVTRACHPPIIQWLTTVDYERAFLIKEEGNVNMEILQIFTKFPFKLKNHFSSEYYFL